LAQHIWEESDLLVTALVAGEPAKPYTGTVDLVFIKNGQDDKPLATESGLALTDGKLEHSFKVPKVAPGEPNYALKVIAVHGATKQTRSDVAEAVVWPRTVTIHAKSETKPNEAKVPLAIVQKEAEGAKPVTGDDGNCTAELAHKAPYTIRSLSPYSIVSDGVDAADLRAHKLTVQRNIVAMFVSPDVSKAPYEPSDATAPDGGQRQFVNLVTAQDGQDACGNEVTFVVSANPKADGRADDRIYVQVTFGHQSKRNVPKPELLNNPAVNDLKNTPNASVYTGWVKLDANAGTARFKVNLGLAGGDTCAVAIGGRKDTHTDASVTLVNWRKLYYELRYPALLNAKLGATQDYADDIRVHLTARLGKAFIVFEKFKSHEFADADATIAKGNGTIIPAAYLKEAGGGSRYVLTNGILQTAGKFSGDAERKTRSVYVSLCDRAFSSNSTAHTLAPLIESADFEIASPAGYLFEPSTKDGSANLKVGTYQWAAVVANAHLQPTVLKFEAGGAPAAAGASPGHVKVVETRRAGKMLDVAFAAKDGGYEDTLSPAERGKIDTFIAGLLADVPGLRGAGNQITCALIGDATDATDTGAAGRTALVRAAIQAKFDATPSSVNMHPGLDDNGVVRKGAMNLAWLSFKDYRTIRVCLPKSAPGTPDHLRILPGDFVGATETDTQCNVKVKFDFSSAGEINGNSGSGEQIMVLRDATAGAVSATICHELGHAMGMTVVPGLNNDLPPPGVNVKHIDSGGTSYVNDNGSGPYAFTDGKRNIHKGGHCAFNVPSAKKAHEKFNGWDPSVGTPGCILWGSGGNADTRTAYCATCLELIKARRLEDIRKSWSGRGAGQG